MERNKALWLPAIYFFLSIYLLPMFPHGGSANELTHWATAASLVEKTSFEISWTRELVGENLEAVSVEDRLYSNKPPGFAVAAAPFYALSRVLIGAPDASNIRISWFVMRFFLSTLPLFLLAFWLYQRDSDEFSLAALLFATPLFVYSLLFFSHVTVGVLLYFAFRLLYDTERFFLRNCFIAGMISGFAALCEFTALIPAAIFAAGMLFADRREPNRLGNIIVYALGALPFAVLLLVYNWSVFGSPLAFFYAYETFPGWMEIGGEGAFGLGLPTLSNIYLLLFSPARGLFFFSPILILSVFAFFTSRERRTLRHRVKIAAIAVSVIALCGHGAAHGGWAFGARYLIFILPLLLDSFFDAENYEFSNFWQGFLFGVSFLFCTIPALTFPFAPPEFRFPHNNFWGELLLVENWFTPNLLNVFGFSSNIWTLLPAVVCFLSVIFIVWRSVRRPKRFLYGLIPAFVLVGVYIFVPDLDTPENEFRRAGVAERFFKPESRLEEFRPQTLTDAAFRRRFNDLEWTIAEARAAAPNDFPYFAAREMSDSPARRLQKAERFQKEGNLAEAESLLQRGKQDFPFARCEFAANLAEIYAATNRSEAALQELESVQDLVGADARPPCLRAQFLLGSLYRDSNRTEESQNAFRRFLANTENSADDEIKFLRQKLGK